MRRPVCYDVTRLLTRILNATPNGIDRIDHALAGHFLARDPAATFGATATGFGARLLPGLGAREAVEAIATHWGESRRDGGDDPTYRRAVAWLARDVQEPAPPRRRDRRLPALHPAGIADWVGRHGIPARTPRRHLPPRSVYVNASQFPLWVASSFEWLEARRDVSAAFFIHDLLPVLMPEYFRKAELERHLARMRNFARFAAAAIVTTPTVADDLQRASGANSGARDVPVFVAPTPIAPVFTSPRQLDPTLAGHPYFVLCSTLEPRKNHLIDPRGVAGAGRAARAPRHRSSCSSAHGAGITARSSISSRAAPALRGARDGGLGPVVAGPQAAHRQRAGGAHADLRRGLWAARPRGPGGGCSGRRFGHPGVPLDRASPILTRLSPLDGEAWLEAITSPCRGLIATECDEPASRRIASCRRPGRLISERLDGFLDAL